MCDGDSLILVQPVFNVIKRDAIEPLGRKALKGLGAGGVGACEFGITVLALAMFLKRS